MQSQAKEATAKKQIAPKTSKGGKAGKKQAAAQSTPESGARSQSPAKKTENETKHLIKARKVKKQSAAQGPLTIEVIKKNSSSKGQSAASEETYKRSSKAS